MNSNELIQRLIADMEEPLYASIDNVLMNEAQYRVLAKQAGFTDEEIDQRLSEMEQE